MLYGNSVVLLGGSAVVLGGSASICACSGPPFTLDKPLGSQRVKSFPTVAPERLAVLKGTRTLPLMELDNEVRRSLECFVSSIGSGLGAAGADSA